MRRPAATCLAFGALLAAGACGGGGEDGGDERRPAQTVRCTPAPDARKVRIAPKWRAGEERTLTIEETRAGGQAPRPEQSRSTARVRVLEAGSKGSSLAWTLDDIAIALGTNLPPGLGVRVADEAEGLELQYAVDRDGAFAAVENVSEVRDRLRRMMQLIESEATGRPELLAVLRQTRSLLESETFIQTSVGEEARLMHSAYGLVLEPGRPAEIDYRLPNPFGGHAIRSPARLELTDARDANGCVTIELTSSLPQDELTRVLADFFRRTGRPPPAASQLAGSSLRHTQRLTYDPGSGWMVRAELTKQMVVGGRERTDRTVVTSR